MSYLLGIIGFLFALFGWERSKRQSAEAKLENAELDKKEAVLEEKQNSVGANASKEQENLDNLEKQKQDALDKQDNATTEDNLDFWNKK